MKANKQSIFFCLILLFTVMIFSCGPASLYDWESESLKYCPDCTPTPGDKDSNATEPTVPTVIDLNADQYENDDTVYSASLIIPGESQAQYHTIHQKGDVDYVQFICQKEGNYRIKLSNIEGFEPALTVLDESLAVIESKNTSAYTGDYDWWGYNSNHEFNQEEQEAILFTAASDGTFYAKISDVYQAHENGKYRIMLTEVLPIGEALDLIATANSQNFQIDLSWDSVGEAEGFYIYRTDVTQDIDAPVYTDFLQIADVSGASNSYIDTDVEPNTPYYYYVEPYSGDTAGGVSNVDMAVFNWESFKPTSALISASEGLSTGIEISLEQKYNSANILRYEIYRSPDQIKPSYELIDSFSQSDSIGTTVLDTEVNSGQYYFYCLKIIFDFNSVILESDYSWFDSGVAN